MIRISDEYYMDTDGYCTTLFKFAGVDKEKKPIYKPCGYYTTIENALEACIRKNANKRLDQGTYSLEEGLEIIREEFAKFEELLARCIPKIGGDK